MKLLIITIDKFPHRGGKSTHISSLISGLENENVECDVFSGDNIPRNKFNVLKLLIYPIKFFSKKRYLYYRKRIELFLFKNKLKKSIKGKKYDAVSFQDAITCGYCGNLFEKSFLTMHTYFGIEYTLDNSGFTLDNPLYKKLLKIEENSLNFVNSIIAVDERIKEHVIKTLKKYGKEMKVYAIPNFTNTDFFKPCKKKNDKVIIACVRRLVEKNGVIYAVKAMKYIDYDNCILKIYGDGPCLDKIKEYIKSNSLESKVELCGGIDNSEVLNIYNECDIVLVPSITVNGLQEATSISAIEAMACGIPTIASNIGGLPILIKNNETGFLVEEKDSKGIAEKIMMLIMDKNLRKEIGLNSREYILENHSHIAAAQNYLEIFKGDRK